MYNVQASLTLHTGEEQLCRVRSAGYSGTVVTAAPATLKCAPGDTSQGYPALLSDAEILLSGVNCTVVACGPFPLLSSEHSATLTLTAQLDTATLATLPSLNITSQVTALLLL